MTANESLKCLYADGEQHGGPHPHHDLDYDYSLGLPWHVAYRSDHYHDGRPAAANRSSPIQHNSSLSHMEDALLSAVAWGPSPPSSLNPSSDGVGLWWHMVAPLESSWFANEQHPSSRCPPQSLLLDPSVQYNHPSYPQESPRAHNPRDNVIPESGGITDHISEPSSLPNLDVIPPGPISEHVYPAAMGARNSECIQTSIVPFWGFMDSNAETVLTDEGLVHHQALSGYANSFAEMSRNGHVPPPPYSVRQHEGQASRNSQLAVQASDHVTVTPSITSNQDAPVDEIPSNFRCRTCGISFVQRQGFNRHKKDKHRRRKTCPLCNSYTWPSGRRYLFLRHLKKHHVGTVLPLAIGRPSDL